MSTLPNVSGVSGTRSITPPRNDFKGRSNNKMSSFSSTGTSSNISTSNRGTSSKFNKSNTTTKSYYNAKKERMSSVISDDDENDDNLPLPVSPENLVYIKDNQLAWIPAIRISSIETEDTAGSSTTADSIRVKVKNYNIVDEQSITLYNFLQEIKKQDFMNTTTLDNWKEMDVKLDQYPGKLLPIQSMFPKGTTSYTDMVEFEHLHEVSCFIQNSQRKAFYFMQLIRNLICIFEHTYECLAQISFQTKGWYLVQLESSAYRTKALYPMR